MSLIDYSSDFERHEGLKDRQLKRQTRCEGPLCHGYTPLPSYDQETLKNFNSSFYCYD